MPGPKAWTNRADYSIHATLDPAAKVLTGEETITYANNSPDTLDVLWLQMDQNRYRPNSRGSLAAGGAPDGTTAGYAIDAIDVVRAGKPIPVTTIVPDTRMQVRLPEPLAAGGKVALHIRWHFTIPAAFGGRMAWGPSSAGDIFDLAQWYPRMAVYDDLRGWDTLPYLDQEFYLDYGDFDYQVTVPSEMIVAGTGELVNPQEVLTASERDRLAKARASDATVMIRAPSEISDPHDAPEAGRHAHLAFPDGEHARRGVERVQGVRVGCGADQPATDGKTALAMSVYPPESAGPAKWGRSTEYLKHAVEQFSARWYPFPWPVAINIAGPASGMEYPGAAFDGIEDAGKDLFWITAHEIGHSWFR